MKYVTIFLILLSCSPAVAQDYGNQSDPYGSLAASSAWTEQQNQQDAIQNQQNQMQQQIDQQREDMERQQQEIQQQQSVYQPLGGTDIR